jgi:hypothetical protein
MCGIAGQDARCCREIHGVPPDAGSLAWLNVTKYSR